MKFDLIQNGIKMGKFNKDEFWNSIFKLEFKFKLLEIKWYELKLLRIEF